jgi:hypothetical protein
LNQLAILRSLLCLILALAARLIILENAIRAPDGRQKLCFRGEDALPLLGGIGVWVCLIMRWAHQFLLHAIAITLRDRLLLRLLQLIEVR